MKKSVVFVDMFATGSLDATETFNDCSVVHLSDHPAELPCELAGLVERVFALNPSAECRPKAPAKCTVALESIHACAQMCVRGSGEALAFRRGFIVMWAAEFGL